jgi:hypothetical protein
MTALSRSLTIAAGAGIAGLCLGLVIGDRPKTSEAEASSPVGAYMLVLVDTPARPAVVEDLILGLESQGALQAVVTGRTHGEQALVASHWSDVQSAQAAAEELNLGPDRAFDAVITPARSAEPAR